MTSPPITVPPPRRAYRSPSDGLLAGVAVGLAEHLRVSARWVRLAFLILSLLNGFGIVLYAGLWMMLPVKPAPGEAPGLAAARRQGRRVRSLQQLVDRGPIVAVGAIVVGLLVFITLFTGQGLTTLPGLIALGGVGLLWWQLEDSRTEGERPSFRAALSSARVVGGISLLVLAITAFVVLEVGVSSWTSVLTVSLAALLGLGALALIVGPWLRRLSNDLSDERAERARADERADVAAHLHDSVLQTLALIQKSAGDPQAVMRLARAQERDLRTWLFSQPTPEEGSVVSALRLVCAEVEDSAGVPVEVVTVGDCPTGDQVRALVQAAREAVFNAATHSGAHRVDVYAEASDAQVEVFVRDRGRGFDPSAVADDRHGVRDSIVARMVRHGGSAQVTSEPGSGTEVRLTMPLTANQNGENA
jgi:signal transduction histidine kinase/phage shock protein PspC (stress-responsive transcriptional regulator)